MIGVDYLKEISDLLDSHEKNLTNTERQKECGYEHILQAKNNAIIIEREIVLPPMKKIGDLLKSKGNDYKIEEELMQDPPTVTMTIYPKPYSQNHSFLMPTLKFVFDVFEERIRVIHDYSYPGRPHMGRKENRYQEQEITPKTVESEIFSFMHEIFH